MLLLTLGDRVYIKGCQHPFEIARVDRLKHLYDVRGMIQGKPVYLSRISVLELCRTPVPGDDPGDSSDHLDTKEAGHGDRGTH